MFRICQKINFPGIQIFPCLTKELGACSSRYVLFRFQTAYERFSSKNFSLLTKWIDNNPVLVAQKGKSKAEMEKENYEKEKREISELSLIHI